MCARDRQETRPSRPFDGEVLGHGRADETRLVPGDHERLREPADGRPHHAPDDEGRERQVPADCHRSPGRTRLDPHPAGTRRYPVPADERRQGHLLGKGHPEPAQLRPALPDRAAPQAGGRPHLRGSPRERPRVPRGPLRVHSPAEPAAHHPSPRHPADDGKLHGFRQRVGYTAHSTVHLMKNGQRLKIN